MINGHYLRQKFVEFRNHPRIQQHIHPDDLRDIPRMRVISEYKDTHRNYHGLGDADSVLIVRQKLMTDYFLVGLWGHELCHCLADRTYRRLRPDNVGLGHSGVWRYYMRVIGLTIEGWEGTDNNIVPGGVIDSLFPYVRAIGGFNLHVWDG